MIALVAYVAGFGVYGGLLAEVGASAVLTAGVGRLDEDVERGVLERRYATLQQSEHYLTDVLVF